MTFGLPHRIAALCGTALPLLATPSSGQEGAGRDLAERRSAFVEECTQHFDNEPICGCTFDRLERYPGFDYTEAQVQRIAEVFAAGSIPESEAMLRKSGTSSDRDLEPKLYLAELAVNACHWELTDIEPDISRERPRGMTEDELRSFGLIED